METGVETVEVDLHTGGRVETPANIHYAGITTSSAKRVIAVRNPVPGRETIRPACRGSSDAGR